MEIKAFKYALPKFKEISNVDTFFEMVKHNFPELKESGFYTSNDKKAIIVYKIHTRIKTHIGLLATVNMKEYYEGNIKKHENTLIKQEENILGLLQERAAIIKPVLLTYKKVKPIKDILNKICRNKKPDFNLFFEKDEQRHEFFIIEDSKNLDNLIKLFQQKVKSSYIADGHHRMASLSNFKKSNPNPKQSDFVLSAFFDFEELSIYDYNRIIHAFDVIKIEDFFKQLSKYAEIRLIKKAKKPKHKNEVILYHKKNYYQLIWKKEIIKHWELDHPFSFDVDLFNFYVLEKILNIKDVRTNPRIIPMEGVKGIKPLLKACKNNSEMLAVSFLPVSFTEFKAVADHNQVLPPKSTWFEPRIKNGILVQNLD